MSKDEYKMKVGTTFLRFKNRKTFSSDLIPRSTEKDLSSNVSRYSHNHTNYILVFLAY